MSGFYRSSVFVFGLVAIAIGVAILAETVAAGGGSVGYLVGILFVALGGGRLYLWRRR